jgi:hypothetical protein
MAKDPAALFFIANWLVATKEMKADCRGWYLNLILHQFDKGDLPSDPEELANLADVRHSEYHMFQQVWQHVLKQKFDVLPSGRIRQAFAAEIVQKREVFKDKRTAAGKMSVYVKFLRKQTSDENVIQFIKSKTDISEVDTSNQHVLKQVFEQMYQLYIITNTNNNVLKKKGVKGEKEPVPSLAFSAFEITTDLALPSAALEAAERNQFALHKTRNTEFIKDQWGVFLSERQNDPPEKKSQYRSIHDLTSYFLNWIRTKKPTSNGKTGSKTVGRFFEAD